MELGLPPPPVVRDGEVRWPQTWCMRLVPVFYGWVVMFAACILYLVSIIGHTTGINMAVPHFTEEFGLSGTNISFMWMLAMVVSASLLPFAGAALDKFGSRRVVHLAMVPYVCVVAATGMVQNEFQLGACVVLMRFLGPEVLTLTASVTPNKWFLRKRGLVAAVLSVIDAALAGFAPVFEALILAFGWRHAYFVLAAVFSVMLVVPAFLLQNDPTEWEGMYVDGIPMELAPHALTAETHSEAGSNCVASVPSGEPQPDSRAPASIDEEAEAGNESAAENTAIEEEDLTFCQVLCMRKFWAVAVTVGAFGMYWSGFNYNAVTVMKTLAGFEAPQTASCIFLPLSISIGCSAFAVGVAMDRMTLRQMTNCLFVAFVSQAGCMVTMLYVSTPTTAILYAVVFGACTGSVQSLMVPMYANLFGTKHLGKIQGLGTGIGVACCGIGPVLFGMSFDLWGTFTPPIIGCAVFLTVCSCMLLTVRPPAGVSNVVVGHGVGEVRPTQYQKIDLNEN